MYKIEKGKPFYYPLLALIYLHNIPRNFEESSLKSFSIKYLAIMVIKMLVAIVMPMLHFIMTLKDNTGVDTTEDVTIFLGMLCCMITLFTFTIQYKNWSQFFTEITTIKNHCVLDENFLRNYKRLSIMFLCYASTGTVLYGIVSLSNSSHCKQLNEEKGLQESCFAYYQSVWFPFDTNNVFSSIAIFTVQVVVVCYLIPPGAMVCFIVFETSELLIWHIQVLKENLMNVFNEKSNQDISARLRFCIIYHIHILRLGRRFNVLQKYSVGYLSIISALGFGFLLNQLQSTKSLGAVIYLLGCVTAVALICQSGQRIIDQTISVGDAVYASNWIKADPQTMKDLAFIILRTRTPIYLDCIPLGIFNYDLFLTIIKASYSYMTLIQETS